jgi:hypothetical protein
MFRDLVDARAAKMELMQGFLGPKRNSPAPSDLPADREMEPDMHAAECVELELSDSNHYDAIDDAIAGEDQTPETEEPYAIGCVKSFTACHASSTVCLARISFSLMTWLVPMPRCAGRPSGRGCGATRKAPEGPP